MLPLFKTKLHFFLPVLALKKIILFCRLCALMLHDAQIVLASLLFITFFAMKNRILSGTVYYFPLLEKD